LTDRPFILANMIEPLLMEIIPERTAPSYSAADERQPILIPDPIWKERFAIIFPA